MDEQDTPGDELWTTGQAASYLRDLGVSRRKVSRLVAAGELSAVKEGPTKWARIPVSEVRAYRRRLLARLAAGRHRADDQ